MYLLDRFVSSCNHVYGCCMCLVVASTVCTAMLGMSCMICVNVYVCMYMYVYVCNYLYVCIYMCVCVCVYVYVCMYMCLTMYVYVCMYMCVTMYMCVCICVYICVCVVLQSCYDEAGAMQVSVCIGVAWCSVLVLMQCFLAQHFLPPYRPPCPAVNISILLIPFNPQTCDSSALHVPVHLPPVPSLHNWTLTSPYLFH